eukprot:scaffold62_cov256-Pinguiococcus_pyrenoidosus.AAC.1
MFQSAAVVRDGRQDDLSIVLHQNHRHQHRFSCHCHRSRREYLEALVQGRQARATLLDGLQGYGPVDGAIGEEQNRWIGCNRASHEGHIEAQLLRDLPVVLGEDGAGPSASFKGCQHDFRVVGEAAVHESQYASEGLGRQQHQSSILPHCGPSDRLAVSVAAVPWQDSRKYLRLTESRRCLHPRALHAQVHEPAQAVLQLRASGLPCRLHPEVLSAAAVRSVTGAACGGIRR